MTRNSQEMDGLVGQRVAALRHAHGLTQTALADRLGVSFQQVQKYEKGTNRISASRLFQLTEVFGCTVSDLFPVRSDPGTPAPRLGGFVASSEGAALIAAFGEISDLGLRRALAQIAVALAKA